MKDDIVVVVVVVVFVIVVVIVAYIWQFLTGLKKKKQGNLDAIKKLFKFSIGLPILTMSVVFVFL